MTDMFSAKILCRIDCHSRQGHISEVKKVFNRAFKKDEWRPVTQTLSDMPNNNRVVVDKPFQGALSVDNHWSTTQTPDGIINHPRFRVRIDQYDEDREELFFFNMMFTVTPLPFNPRILEELESLVISCLKELRASEGLKKIQEGISTTREYILPPEDERLKGVVESICGELAALVVFN